MNQAVITLFWVSLAVYGLATVLFVWGALLKRERLVRAGMWVAGAGLVAHTAAVALRWIAAGRIPVIEDYENALVTAWATVIAFFLLTWRYPRLRPAGALVMPFVLLTLGYGATISPAIPEYADAYKSPWLVTHVIFAWMTYATYSVAAGCGLAEILKTRAEKRGPLAAGSFYDRLPSIPVLQDVTFRLVVFGFLVNAVMIASGAIWAYRLWGSYWSWDPVENWSLITWLAYGLYLHLRLTIGWRGTRLAWIAVLALVGVMMTFWGIQLFPTTYHLFRQMKDIGRVGGPGRIPGL